MTLKPISPQGRIIINQLEDKPIARKLDHGGGILDQKRMLSEQSGTFSCGIL